MGFHSNAIEGNSLNENQIVDFIQNGITISGKPFKDLLDVYYHDKALRWALGRPCIDKTLTPNDVLKIHSLAHPPGFDENDPV